MPIYGPRLNHLTVRRLREQYKWDELLANNTDLILVVRALLPRSCWLRLSAAQTAAGLLAQPSPSSATRRTSPTLSTPTP